MASPKPKGPQATFPHCERHITNAGWTLTEAAVKSGVSTSSISRMKKNQPVLVTTVVKLINALNYHHYVSIGRPLNPDVEIVRLAA